MVRKTVLHLADYGGPYAGNFILFLKALHKTLVSVDWREVLIFSEIARGRPWLKELEKEGIPIYFLPVTSSWRMAHALEIIATHEKAHIFHTHFTAFDISAWIALKLRKLKGQNCNLIWQVHSPVKVKHSFSRRIKDRIKFRFMGEDAQIVVVSEGGWHTMHERGMIAERSQVIVNGIDLERKCQVTKTRNEVRGEFAFQDDNVVLLLLGWDPLTKGVDLTLEALKNLRQHDNKIKLMVVGTDELEKYLSKLYGATLPDWLKIAPPTESIYNYYAAADIFVSASRNEGFPYAVAEAMWSGLPVVLSDIPGLKWAQEASGATFFPSGDSRELARAIAEILTWPPEKRQLFVSANQALIMEKYNLKICADRFLDLYKNIAG
jgi:glycosyltransferase involved in cell wall biosynthesis